MNRAIRGQLITDLAALRALLATAKAWSRKGYAFDARGLQVFPAEASATSWSISGGIYRVAGADPMNPMEHARRVALRRALNAAGKQHGHRTLNFLDKEPEFFHSDLLRMIDEAVARATTALPPLTRLRGPEGLTPH